MLMNEIILLTLALFCQKSFAQFVRNKTSKDSLFFISDEGQYSNSPSVIRKEFFECICGQKDLVYGQATEFTGFLESEKRPSGVIQPKVVNHA